MLREGVRQKVGLVDRFDTLLENDATGSDLLTRATKLDLENLSATRAGVTDETWSAITEALSTAETVFVVGARKSYAATYLLGYLLGLVREPVVTTGPGVPGFPDALSGLGPRDVLVAITIRRYTADTVRAAHFARDRQATAVALTDDISSPLVAFCQHALFVNTEGPSVLRSMTGMVSLVQALVAEVAQQRGARTREHLLEEETLLEHFDTYFCRG